MSIREQERRQREVEKRIDAAMRRADREVRGAIEERSRQADLRAKEVVRRIVKGDVEPRSLPGMREDSLDSMDSMESMESLPPIKSMGSADPVMDAKAGAETGEAGEEQKASEMAGQMTGDTGSEGDMSKHAGGKVAQHGGQMFKE